MSKKNKKKQIVEDIGIENELVEETQTSANESEASMEAADADQDLESSNEEENELAEFGSTNIYTEEEVESFLPEATEDDVQEEMLADTESVEGTELDSFESAEIEEVEFIEETTLDSIIESILFASDRPVSLNSIKLVFKGTNVKTDKIRRALDRYAVELASSNRGVTLEEVPGGYQLRTKIDNMHFLTRTLKARPFKLSGPALEVLAIAAYKQPLVKSEIDEIRGVESGHLLRALMEKGLVTFEGKSDLPGKPMLYGTTKKFLEIFGLRNVKELPTLSQIDELLPEGMTEEEAEKPTLSQITAGLSQAVGMSYSEGEEELSKINDQLAAVDTSTEFFEQEKLLQKQKRDAEKAQDVRDALAMGEEVSTRDKNWLTKYDEALQAGNMATFSKQDLAEEKAEHKAEEVQASAEMEEMGFTGESEINEGLFEEEEDTSIDGDMALDHMDVEDDDRSGEASV